MDNIDTKKRNIIIILVAALVIIPLTFFIISRIFSSTIIIAIAPRDSIITLNGKSVQNGNHKVTPGEYTIAASHEGFTEQTKTITIEADQTSRVNFILISNDPSTIDWYKNHPEDQRLLEGASSWEFDSKSSELANTYPILQYLPHQSSSYHIGYGQCSDGSPFCIIIAANIGYRTAALNHLASFGNPALYKIEFTNYYNPFMEGSNVR